MTDAERAFYLSRRQALLIELGALEDLLGLARSVTPKRKRGATHIAVTEMKLPATIRQAAAMPAGGEIIDLSEQW